MKRTAIVLIDGSEHSKRALEWACIQLAPIKDVAKLIILSVDPPSLHSIYWLREFKPLELLPTEAVHVHVCATKKSVRAALVRQTAALVVAAVDTELRSLGVEISGDLRLARLQETESVPGLASHAPAPASDAAPAANNDDGPALVRVDSVSDVTKWAKDTSDTMDWSKALEETAAVSWPKPADHPAASSGPLDVMVVLGARGLGRSRRIVLGSVSTSVVRHLTGTVPVVVIRPEAPVANADADRHHDFVVCDDGGDAGKRAVAWTAEHVHAGTRVLILHLFSSGELFEPAHGGDSRTAVARSHHTIDETFAEPAPVKGDCLDHELSGRIELHHACVRLAGAVAEFKRVTRERFGDAGGVSVIARVYNGVDADADLRDLLCEVIEHHESAGAVVLGTHYADSKLRRKLASLRGSTFNEFVLNHIVKSTFIEVP
jgi:hypothetical protein